MNNGHKLKKLICSKPFPDIEITVGINPVI